jgi:short-subunit dehydrogenase
MKVAVVGASGSLGRKICEVEASKGNDLLIVATDQRDLNALKSDLEIRYGIQAKTLACSLSATPPPPEFDRTCGRDYFPLGISSSEDGFGVSSQVAVGLLGVNLIGPCLWMNDIILNRTQSTVDFVGFGSIAETRGRSSNVFYSLSKRGLTSFFESLLHLPQQAGIRPYLFQIGYLQSQQTLGKELKFPIAKPEPTAIKIWNIVDSGKTGIYYVPYFWRWICFVLRFWPWRWYRLLKF